ncbi:MAG: hypothetical protein ACSLE2_03985 [Lysobacterales bacterium]
MKVAISVPDPIFNAAERLAKQRRIARSQLFTEALAEYLSRHGAEAVTARLDEVYATEDSGVEASLLHAQLTSIDHEAW